MYVIISRHKKYKKYIFQDNLLLIYDYLLQLL